MVARSETLCHEVSCSTAVTGAVAGAAARKVHRETADSVSLSLPTLYERFCTASRTGRQIHNTDAIDKVVAL